MQTHKNGHSPNRYLTLINHLPPRIVKNDDEYTQVQTAIDALIDQGELSEDEQDYLSLLGLLLADYDQRHLPFPTPRGVALVNLLVEEMGLKTEQLTSIFETDSAVSAVLDGDQTLTAEHIEKLSTFFQLPHELFFEENRMNGYVRPFERSGEHAHIIAV